MLVIPNACEGPRKLGMTCLEALIYSALSVTNFASITVVTEI